MFDPTSPAPRPSDQPLVHLPSVSQRDLDDFVAAIVAIRDGVPEFGSTLPKHHWEGAAAEYLSHGEALVFTVPLIEALLDQAPTHMSVEMIAQLCAMAMYPAVPEAMVLQIAFGRKIGEQHSLKIARLLARARRRGVSADEYVAELAAQEAIPHDKLVRLLRGEARRAPSTNRVRKGITLLRRVASFLPCAFQPPLLCSLAWLHWSRGQRAIALAYLREATRIDPSNVLAGGLSATFSERLPAWLDR